MERRVLAILNQGKIVSEKVLIFLYFCLGYLLLMPLVTITAVVAICLGYMQADTEIIMALASTNILGFCAIVLLLLAIIKQKKLHKSLRLYSEDAFQTVARINRLDKNNLYFKCYQVQLEYEINGKVYSKISKPDGVWYPYNKILQKFDGKSVNILYSPKYDQVMILKN